MPQYHSNKTFVLGIQTLYHFYCTSIPLYQVNFDNILSFENIDDMMLLIIYDYLDNTKHFLCFMMSGVCIYPYNIYFVNQIHTNESRSRAMLTIKI